MAPSSWPEHPVDLLDGDAGDLLIELADRAIRDGLSGRSPAPPDPADLPPALRHPVGSFVTLHVGEELNGCIGSIESSEPLASAVARHAWSSAFDDPRLPPLRPADYDELIIEISILSPLADVAADTRAELIAALRPGADGLVITVGSRRAVFLPTVWETLATPERFVEQLFVKAGCEPGYWGPDVRACTFTTARIGGHGRGGDPETDR